MSPSQFSMDLAQFKTSLASLSGLERLSESLSIAPRGINVPDPCISALI